MGPCRSGPGVGEIDDARGGGSVCGPEGYEGRGARSESMLEHDEQFEAKPDKSVQSQSYGLLQP
jgi:hypothetical protein